MPKFSIIVPIYKVEQYLKKCIESILAQTFADFELILIDDGSPDGSGAVCDAYAAHDRRVRSVHQPNGGAGAARNHGIELSTGEYLLFVDGDDYLAPTLLAELSAAMEQTHSDLYLFGAIVERDGKKVGELHERVPVGTICSAADRPELFFGIMAPWNRAYRRSLFFDNDISFATRVWYEDIRVVTKLNAVAASAFRLEGAYYHYLQRDGSAMNNRNAARNAEILAAFDDILSWYDTHGLSERYRSEVTYLAIEHLFLAATVRVLLIDPSSPLIDEFRAYMERKFPDFTENRYLPLLGKSRALVFRLLLKKRYRTVRLLFRIKNRLG